MKLINIFFVFTILVIFSCEEIKEPLKEKTESTCGDESLGTPIKKILIEDFTGHKCPNCPDAANILEEIIDEYCDHIVPITVHIGLFAAPDAEFTADYRTETGTEIGESYGISNLLPLGLVDRTEYELNLSLGRENWKSAVDLLYDLQARANIILETEYNETDNKVTVHTSTEFLAAIDHPISLGLYLTEDSIISPQKTDTGTIENYVHRHMLRKGINGAFGEEILGSAQFGQSFEKTFTFDVDPEWVIDKCEIVAFISNTETKEIIQAESEHIIE